MSALVVKRPDTLELTLPAYYRQRNLQVSRDQMCNSVLNLLGRDAANSIKCLQRSSSGGSFRVTFKPNKEALKDRLLMEGIILHNTPVFFRESEPRGSSVLIQNLPTEVPDTALGRHFSQYGQIRKIVRAKDALGIETGDRRMLITLSHHIPNLMHVGKFSCLVNYQGQPMCCHHCNWWGHTYRRCPFRGACRHCGDKGHHSEKCTQGAVLPPPYPVDGLCPDEAHPANCPNTDTDQQPSTDPPAPPDEEADILGSTSDISDMDEDGDGGGLAGPSAVDSLVDVDPDAPGRAANTQLSPSPSLSNLAESTETPMESQPLLSSPEGTQPSSSTEGTPVSESPDISSFSSSQGTSSVDIGAFSTPSTPSEVKTPLQPPIPSGISYRDVAQKGKAARAQAQPVSLKRLAKGPPEATNPKPVRKKK